jgi:putative membrane protein
VAAGVVHRLLPYLIGVAAAALSPEAAALHDPRALSADPWRWNLEPWLAFMLVGSALLYVRGVAVLWRKAGIGRGSAAIEAARFAIGWLALAAALLSPLDVLAARSFGIHMIQHEALMVVAAPLLVLGRPLEAWAWATPPGALRALAALAHSSLMSRAWRAITEPVGAWCFHALALWIWHLPVLFNAALTSPSLHVLQHASFFGSALAFWWAVFGRSARAPDPTSMASLLTTMLHTGALGALLTFAPSAWYSLPGPPLLDPLEDQQLGGLVMWVPGSLAYLFAGLAIIGRWLRRPADVALHR